MPVGLWVSLSTGNSNAMGHQLTYKNLVGSMTESIKIDKFLDLPWQAQKRRVHNIGKVSCHGLHVTAWVGGCS